MDQKEKNAMEDGQALHPADGNAAASEKEAPEAAGTRSSRGKGILFIVVVIAIMAAMMIAVGRPLLAVSRDPEALEAYLESQGIRGVWIYMGLVILQIFAAVVPGGPFEIAGGYLYGALPGALICDAAMTVGSVLVFLISRKAGRKFVYLFFSENEIRSVRFLHTSEKKEFLLFLFFLIPGTPKDLMSYVVGLTDVSLKSWIFITAVGRFPAIYLSTLSGTALESRNYGIFILVLLLIGVLSVLGLFMYQRKNRKEEENRSEKNAKEKQMEEICQERTKEEKRTEKNGQEENR